MATGTFEELFVGREDEQKKFRGIIDGPLLPEGTVLYYPGPGGSGKTWLMRRLIDIANEDRYKDRVLAMKRQVDLVLIRTHYLEGLLEELHHLLCDAGLDSECAFPNYLQAVQDLVTARSQAVGDSQQRIQVYVEHLPKAFRQDLLVIGRDKKIVLFLDTYEVAHNTPVGKWLVSRDGLLVPGIVLVICGRTRNPLNQKQPDIRGLDPTEVDEFYQKYLQTPEFVGEAQATDVLRLNKLLDGNPLFLGLALTIPQWDQGIWSRRELDRLEKLGEEARQREIKNFLITTLFSAGHVGRYSLTKSNRILLYAMAYLHPRFNKFFLRKLVEEGYISLDDDGQDLDTTLTELWENLQPQALFFVKERPEGEIQLHDQFKDLLLGDPIREEFDKPGWDKFANAVVRWYDELINETAKAESPDRALLDTLKVEKLIYALRLKAPKNVEYYFNLIDIDTTLQTLQEYSKDRSDRLHRLVAEEIKPASFDEIPFEGQKPWQKLFEIYRLLGVITRRGYQEEVSRQYFKKAYEAAEATGNHHGQVWALFGQHNSTWQNDPTQSLKLLTDAKTIIEAHNFKEYLTELYYEFGFTYRQLEQLEESVRWYEKAHDICKSQWWLGTILNDMGFAKCHLGKYSEGTINVREGLRVRADIRAAITEQIESIRAELENPALSEEQRRLLEERLINRQDAAHGANIRLGYSYNTLGEILRYQSNLSEATADYSQARDIFVDEDDPGWQVRALYSRGEAHRRLAIQMSNTHRPKPLAEFDEKAERDISEAVRMCEQYHLPIHLATAFRRKGRLFHDRAMRETNPDLQYDLLLESEKALRTALDAAKANNQVLEELECLTEIAFLGDDLINIQSKRLPAPELDKEIDRAIRFYKELQQGIEGHKKDPHRIHNFSVFEHLFQMEIAASLFSRALVEYQKKPSAAVGKFEKSQAGYLDAFTSLAKDPGYGTVRFDAHIDHLFANIRRLPSKDKQEEWLIALRDRWKKENLDTSKPEIIERCNNILKRIEVDDINPPEA